MLGVGRNLPRQPCPFRLASNRAPASRAARPGQHRSALRRAAAAALVQWSAGGSLG